MARRNRNKEEAESAARVGRPTTQQILNMEDANIRAKAEKRKAKARAKAKAKAKEEAMRKKIKNQVDAIKNKK